MMKYFTLDDWIAGQDVAHYDPNPGWRLADKYKEYITSIRHQLPRDLAQLTEHYSLHDCTLRHVQIDLKTRQATLHLNPLQISTEERFDMSLRYEGVVSFESTADPERGLPGPHGYGDLGYDELERLDAGHFEHRFLFSTGVYFAVRFHNFQMTKHSSSG